MKQAGKKVGIILTLIFAFFAIVVVTVGFVIWSITSHSKQPTEAKAMIEVLSVDARVFYVPEGKEVRNFAINAKLRFPDGSVKDSAEALHFVSSDEILSVDENGKMTVEQDVFGETSQYNVRPVTVTVSCDDKEVENKDIHISVVPYPQYVISLDANGGSVEKEFVDAWEGQSVDDPNTDIKEALPVAELGGVWTFEGWYRVLEDGTLDSKQFNEDDKYYWGKDIKLRARYSAKLSLDDDMGSERQVIDQKFYYKEGIPSESLLPTLSSQNGWNFEGWYTQQGGGGFKYGIDAAQDIYASEVPVLYAKWTCDNVECVYEGTNSRKTEIHAVYNGEFTFDELDFGGGELAYWYVRSGADSDAKLMAGGRYTFSANSTLYAKIKYKIMLHWQDAPHDDTEQYYAIYGDTLASVGWTLPSPILNNGIDENGWQFEGWYRDQGTYSQKFDENTLFNDNGQIDLYALRKSDFILYDQLKMNDGSVVATEEGRNLSVIYGNELSFGSPYLNDDWTFDGFFTNADGTGEQVASTDMYKGNGSRNLYAKWDTSVTLFNDPILLTDTKFNTSFNITYKAAISDSDLPAHIVYKEDGQFLGWYTEPGGDGVKVQAGDTYAFTTKITLYAKVQLKILIDYQGADDLDGGKEEYSVIFGKSLKESVPDYIGGVMPRKNSWTFDGYFYGDMNQSETKYELETQKFEFAKNLQLYVRWVGKLNAYGIMPEAFDDQGNKTVDMYFNRPLPLAQLIEDGKIINNWRFDGWSTDPKYGISADDTDGSGSNTKVDSTEIYKGNGELSIYARWLGTIKFQTTLADSTLDTKEIQLLLGTVPKGIPVPSRNARSDSGYKFAGWYDIDFSMQNAAILGNKLDESEMYFDYKSGVTFYEGAKFTLRFSAPESNDRVEDIEVFYHKKLSVSLQDAGKEIKDVGRTDVNGKRWHFGGWFYNGETKTDENYVYGFANDIEVQAKWESEITLYLNGNGGDKWDKMTDIEQFVTLYVPEGDKLSKHLSGVPQGWGSWTIEGWYTDSSYIDQYNTDEEIKTPEMRLYPKWVAENIKVYYSDNDSTIETIGRKIVYGRRFGELPTKSVVRTGYNVTTEWYSSSDFSENSRINMDTTVYEKNFDSLYLKWTPKKYTIRLKEYYVESNGVKKDKLIENAATYGEILADIDAPESRDGLSCYSYSYSDSHSEKVYLVAGKGENNKNILMGSAVWDIDASDIIELSPTFVAELKSVKLLGYKGDKGSDSIEISASVDQKLPDMDPSKVIMRTGYDFIGYFNVEAAEGGTQYFDQSMHYVKGSNWDIADTVLYPRFKAQQIVVTLFENEYTDNEKKVKTTIKCSVDSRPGNLDKSFAVEKEGYDFLGYFTPSGVQYYDAEMTSCQEGNWNYGDTELYPQFKVKSYKIKIVNEDCSHLYVSNIWPMTTYNPMKKGMTVGDGHEIGTAAYNTRITLQFSGDSCKPRVDYLIGGKDLEDTKNEYQWKFTMLASDVTIIIKCDSDHCVVAGTLITLADGTQKPVEELKGDEMLLVWNLYTGQFDIAPILFVAKHETEVYDIIKLNFSDGTFVKVIGEHGFWDYDLNKYVYIGNNAEQFVGHWFNKQGTDSFGNMINQRVQLTSIEYFSEETTAYSPNTYGHLCYYVNGMLSMPAGTKAFVNIFDVDPQTMKIDEEKMAADIDKYGLFTYEEFLEYLPVYLPEIAFYACNDQYLKVALGKGLITWDDIFDLLDLFVQYWPKD